MMRCSCEKQQNTWDGTDLQPHGLESGCQTQDGHVLSYVCNMLCGVSQCLVNGVLSLGVQRLPAQVEGSESERLSLGKTLVTLGKVQEESQRAVNIGAEGQGSSGCSQAEVEKTSASWRGAMVAGNHRSPVGKRPGRRELEGRQAPRLARKANGVGWRTPPLLGFALTWIYVWKCSGKRQVAVLPSMAVVLTCWG